MCTREENINQNVHVAYLERYKRPLSVIIPNLEILKYLVYFDARLFNASVY